MSHAFFQPTPKPKLNKDERKLTFVTFGPKISPEYQRVINKHKLSQERINKRGPFLPK